MVSPYGPCCEEVSVQALLAILGSWAASLRTVGFNCTLATQPATSEAEKAGRTQMLKQ